MKTNLIKVSFRKQFGPDGTVYTQQVRVTQDNVKGPDGFHQFYKELNDLVNERINDANEKHLTYFRDHLRPIQWLASKDNIYLRTAYLTLTQLSVLKEYLLILDIDNNVKLNRNTILIINMMWG